MSAARRHHDLSNVFLGLSFIDVEREQANNPDLHAKLEEKIVMGAIADLDPEKPWTSCSRPK
jgi:hypothetical protein